MTTKTKDAPAVEQTEEQSEDTKLDSMFGETDIPQERRVGARKFDNPFFAVVAERKGVKKALTFNLAHITDDEDDEETMERVVQRARRMLTEAGDKVDATVRMLHEKDAPAITFWVLPYKVSKPRTPSETTETATDTTDGDPAAPSAE